MAWYYFTLTYLTLPYLILSYLTLPYLTLPYLTLPYLTLPYLTLPYLTLPYLTLPYLTLPYLTLHDITIHYITLHYILLLYYTNTHPDNNGCFPAERLVVDYVTSPAECTDAVGEFHLTAVICDTQFDGEGGLRVVPPRDLSHVTTSTRRANGATFAL